MATGGGGSVTGIGGTNGDIHDSIPGVNGTSWRVRAMVTMTGSGPLTVTPYVRCLHL